MPPRFAYWTILIDQKPKILASLKPYDPNGFAGYPTSEAMLKARPKGGF